LFVGGERALATSRDNLDRLYRDASNSLTILERSHRFTMTEDEILRLRQLVSSKDSIVKDLRASKKSVAQELEAARLATKVVEDNCATLKAQRDKAMDKAICATLKAQRDKAMDKAIRDKADPDEKAWCSCS
jgi:hypothetical protein